MPYKPKLLAKIQTLGQSLSILVDATISMEDWIDWFDSRLCKSWHEEKYVKANETVAGVTQQTWRAPQTTHKWGERFNLVIMAAADFGLRLAQQR